MSRIVLIIALILPVSYELSELVRYTAFALCMASLVIITLMHQRTTISCLTVSMVLFWASAISLICTLVLNGDIDKKISTILNVWLIALTIVSLYFCNLSIKTISQSFLIALVIGICLNAASLSDFDLKSHNTFDLFLGGSVTNFNLWLSLLFIPSLISIQPSSDKKSIGWIVLCLSIGLILMIEILFGGRSGLLILVIAIYLLYFAKLKTKNILLLSLFFIMFIWLSHLMASHLRLDRLYNAEWSNTNSIYLSLNWFSAGRLDQYMFGIERFIECPLIGCGLGEVDYHGFEIHNVYIRLLAEGGLILFTIILIPIFYILSTPANPFFRAVLISALIGGLFEPNLIFGNFGISIPFWIIATYVLRMQDAPEQGHG